MFFFPLTILFFILFFLSLPVLFLLGYFQIVIIGFQNLGISSEATFFILSLILFGSFINIPLTKKKLVLVRESRFFGLFNVPKMEAHYIAINFGGAVVPVLLSFYFLITALIQGVELGPIFKAILFMIIISKLFSKVIPGKGVVLPTFIPPFFSALFALILAPEFSAPVAFISGVLGTLIGADILNLGKMKKYGGYLSIGGAGVFDGIFLVGIISALISGF